MADDKVVKLYTSKTAKDPDAMLEMAKGDFRELCIIGVNKSGNIEGRATNSMTIAELMFYMEHIKQILLSYNPNRYDEDDDE